MENEHDLLFLKKRALRGTHGSAVRADDNAMIRKKWKALKQKDELEDLFA